MPQFRTLLLHSRVITREGLLAVLGEQRLFVVVGATGCPREAVKLIKDTDPHVVVAEARVGDADAGQLTQLLRDVSPSVKVVLLADKFFPAEVNRARQAGAAGYLASVIGKEALVKALKNVAQRGWCEPFDPARNDSANDAPLQPLSAREKDVLDLMRRGMSNADIGKALHISSHTVLTHAKSLFSKLGVATRAEAVTAGFEQGFFKPSRQGRLDGTWVLEMS